jgi:organic hydroperoxide reductase OsmC/OhrA
MSILKDFRFTVDVQGGPERVVDTTTDGGLALPVATSPEFRGGVHGQWSPEHLLVAATASCYALTLAAVAERRQVPLDRTTINGVGHVTRRADGRFGFVVVELAVEIATEPEFVEQARRAARAAESGCLIAQALRIPVEVELNVRVAVPAAA